MTMKKGTGGSTFVVHPPHVGQKHDLNPTLVLMAFEQQDSDPLPPEIQSGAVSESCGATRT